MNVARFSLRNRLVVWMLIVAVAAWGLFNFSTISRREDPEIKISIALVITIWPGKGAEDVERLVTKKLEDEIEKMGALSELRSTSRENVSLIFVDVNYNVDEQMEWQKLRNRIDDARDELPDGVIGPWIMDDFGDVTSMVWSLHSKTADPAELKAFAKRLKARLVELDTVGKCNLLGEQEEVIYIEGPLESFTMYGFSPLVAAKALEYHNVNFPAGYLRTPDRNLRLDATGTFELIEQIENAVVDVSMSTGTPLKVRDVFSVRRDFKDPSNSRMLTMGEPSIGLDVRMQKGHNVVKMGEDVKRVVAEFEKTLPDHIKLELLHDQPREVAEFIDIFMDNLYEGLIIVVAVMMLIMGIRPTLIVAFSLPMSIIATLAFMPILDIDLETVSIGAFIIALGMLVDNAIIVIDNVSVHLDRGKTPFQAACEGTHELWQPILSGTAATVLAFLPLLLLEDEMGSYVRAMPWVVTISMVASFVLAMTVIPVLAALFLKPSNKKAMSAGPGLGARAYARLLNAGMKARYLVVLLALAGLVGAVALIPEVGLSFFPEWDRDQLTVDIWLPEGAGIERTEKTVLEVQEILKEFPDDIVNWATYVGEGGPRFHITVMPQFNTLNYARFMVNTKDKNRTRSLVWELNEKFRARIVGARVTAANLLLGIPVEAPIAIKISGDEMDTMRSISKEIQDILRATEGTDQVRDNIGQEVASLSIDIDSEAANMVGLTNTEVALALLSAHEGLPVTDFRDGEDRIPVILRANEEDRRSAQTLSEIRVPSQLTGAKVPLSAFATVSPQWAPGVIHRRANQRLVTVLADTNGRLASDILRSAWPKIEALDIPDGYEIANEGEEIERKKAFDQLVVIFVMIIVALLFMLTVQFKSIKRALTILFSVPLAIIGAVLGLYFSNNSFGFMAFLGVVSLAGIVIKNAVVWVEFVDRALEDGQDLGAAIIDAGIKRFRPIILTAATTIGGLIPLALFGGVLWEGMAWAMIVGLALATVLTLYVIPVIYYMLFRPKFRGQILRKSF